MGLGKFKSQIWKAFGLINDLRVSTNYSRALLLMSIFILAFDSFNSATTAKTICANQIEMLGVQPLSAEENLALRLLTNRLRAEIHAPWELELLEKTALSIVQRLKSRLENHGLKKSEVKRELDQLLSAAEDELVLRFKKLRRDEGQLQFDLMKVYRNRMAVAIIKAIELTESEWRSMMPTVGLYFDQIEDPTEKSLVRFSAPRIAYNLDKRVTTQEKDPKKRLARVKQLSEDAPLILKEVVSREIQNPSKTRIQRIVDQVGKRISIKSPSSPQTIVIQVHPDSPFPEFEVLKAWLQTDLKSATPRRLLQEGVAEALASEIYAVAKNRNELTLPTQEIIQRYYQPVREKIIHEMRKMELQLDQEHYSDKRWFEVHREVVSSVVPELRQWAGRLADQIVEPILIQDMEPGHQMQFIELLNKIRDQAAAEALIFSSDPEKQSQYQKERIAILSTYGAALIRQKPPLPSEEMLRKLYKEAPPTNSLREEIKARKPAYMEHLQTYVEKSNDPRVYFSTQVFEDSLDAVIQEIFWQSRFAGHNEVERDEAFRNFALYLGRPRAFDNGSLQPVYRHALTRVRERLPSRFPSMALPYQTANLYLKDLRLFLQPGVSGQKWLRYFDLYEDRLLPHEYQLISQMMRSDSPFWRHVYERKSGEAAQHEIPVRDYVESFMPKIAEWTLEALYLELMQARALDEASKRDQLIRIRNHIFSRWNEFRNPIPEKPVHIAGEYVTPIDVIPVEPALAERLEENRIEVKRPSTPLPPLPRRPIRRSSEFEREPPARWSASFFQSRNPDERILTGTEEVEAIRQLEAREKLVLEYLLLTDPKAVAFLQTRIESIQAQNLHELKHLVFLTENELKDSDHLEKTLAEFEKAVQFLSSFHTASESRKSEILQQAEHQINILQKMTRTFSNRFLLRPLLTSNPKLLGDSVPDSIKSAITEWQALRSEFLDLNYRLALNEAIKFGKSEEDIKDATSEAMGFLMESLDFVEYRRGNKFSTSAVTFIQNGLSKWKGRSKSITYAPEVSSEERRLVDQFFVERGFIPTPEELSQFATIPMMRAKRILQFINVSKDAVPESDFITKPESNPLDQMGPNNRTPESIETRAGQEERNGIKSLMEEHLTSRELEIISKRFGLDNEPSQTYRDIGLQINLSQQGVINIERLALLKLRVAVYSKKKHFAPSDQRPKIAKMRLGLGTDQQELSFTHIAKELGKKESEVRSLYEDFIEEVNDEMPQLF